jgi:hypothetical protein
MGLLPRAPCGLWTVTPPYRHLALAVSHPPRTGLELNVTADSDPIMFPIFPSRNRCSTWTSFDNTSVMLWSGFDLL